MMKLQVQKIVAKRVAVEKIKKLKLKLLLPYCFLYWASLQTKLCFLNSEKLGLMKLLLPCIQIFLYLFMQHWDVQLLYSLAPKIYNKFYRNF